MQRRGSRRVEIGFDKGEIATGNRARDARGGGSAVRESDRERSVGRHVCGRQHVDRAAVDRDDRSRSDGVVGDSGRDDVDGAVDRTIRGSRRAGQCGSNGCA